MSDSVANITQEIRDSLVSADLRRSSIAGSVAAVIIAVGTLSVSLSSGIEAKTLLQEMIPTVRTFCSALLPASTTLLALMLTAISFTNSYTEDGVRSEYYERVQKIALLDVTVFVATVVLLLFLAVPLLEAENISPFWYTGFYYFVLTYAAILGGFVIATMLLLYSAVQSLVAMANPDRQSNIRVREESA